MAKLTPKDPQFGIPIAARIKAELAFALKDEADKQGISFSKYLSQYLQDSSAQTKRIIELEQNLKQERELAKTSVAQFIHQITDGDEKEIIRLAEIYNNILNALKNQ